MVLALLIAVSTAEAQEAKSPPPGVPADNWLADPNVFPIAVWLQSPSNAAKYREIGINLYVALYSGTNEQKLAELKRNGMHVIVGQNESGLRFKEDPTIVGWMHGDEPDNAQAKRGNQKGYDPPVPTEKIIADYQRIKANDPTRPVMLNLGQGVAWDGWIGRGVRTNHPEDYVEYVKGSDIVSFDIYPACHDNKAVAGKLWMVPDGVSRLRKWSDDRKTVWNCIETTNIENPDPNVKATPQQVKAEVWMSIVRGSRGLIYFCHKFKPMFIEAGLLADAEMATAVGKVNRQIQELAPVLNSPTIENGAKVESSSAEVPIEVMVKRHSGATYLFAVGMRDGATTAGFQVDGLKGTWKVDVLGEDRKLEVVDGKFRDNFKPWDVHLYRLPGH